MQMRERRACFVLASLVAADLAV
ncbi:hypothetical protein NOCARDAX2BIS_80044 [Nocardioides sp. AX2bis]|nr:hypothetical protein NOCARDAX2BIS_80044 [Nocardioides sp. AX2bis]